MRTVAELQHERSALFAEAEGLLEDADENERQLNEDEESRYQACCDRIEVLNVDIDRRMRLEESQKKRLKQDAISRAGGKRPPSDPDNEGGAAPAMAQGDGNGQHKPNVSIPRSYGKLIAFPKTREGEMHAYRSGMFLRAAIYGDTKAADWCRQNGVGVRAALSGGVNTAGGVLVPEEFERAIIDLREQYGVFRQVCRVSPMGSDTLNVPRRVGGNTAYYVGEGSAGTESDPSWDNVQLTAKKLMCLTRLSSELAEDATIDVADQLAQEMAYAFALKEDQAGFIGDGTATYGGIRGVFVKAVDGNHTKATIAAAAGHDTLAEIDADDLISIMAMIPQYAKMGSAWFCSPSAAELIFNAIKIAGGGNTRDILAQADVPRFLGYPIYVSDILADGPATDYTGLAILGFGNLRMAATLGDRRGVRVALSMEQYWEEDQVGVKGTMRHDIVVHDLGSTTVKSPFVVLTGGSGAGT